MSRFFAAVLVVCVFAITAADARNADPKPAKWCGWFLRHELGEADRRFNRADQWAHIGTRADGPAVGVIVVWRHHVGIVTGGSPGHWIIKSGNDGGRVRERERNLRGAIAFRWPR